MAHILVVDDDATLREALCDFLAAEHFTLGVATAEDALTALEAEDYDLVLTDISMPGMSGVELLGHIRSRQPTTPVIVISGIGSEGYAQGLLNLGAFAYLTKPFKLDDVEAAVARALAERTQTLTTQAGDPTRIVKTDKPKLYVLSICAANARTSDNQHAPSMVVASSPDEARQKGIELAHEKWPRAEGWIEHSVVAAELESGLI